MSPKSSAAESVHSAWLPDAALYSCAIWWVRLENIHCSSTTLSGWISLTSWSSARRTASNVRGLPSCRPIYRGADPTSPPHLIAVGADAEVELVWVWVGRACPNDGEDGVWFALCHQRWRVVYDARLHFGAQTTCTRASCERACTRRQRRAHLWHTIPHAAAVLTIDPIAGRHRVYAAVCVADWPTIARGRHRRVQGCRRHRRTCTARWMVLRQPKATMQVVHAMIFARKSSL